MTEERLRKTNEIIKKANEIIKKLNDLKGFKQGIFGQEHNVNTFKCMLEQLSFDAMEFDHFLHSCKNQLLSELEVKIDRLEKELEEL